MPFNITCETCRSPLQVQESYVGKKVRCPACKTVTTVPRAPLGEFEPQSVPDISLPPDIEIQKRTSPRVSHQFEFEIVGGDLQLVEIALDPGEIVVAEAGTMTYVEENIDFTTRMGDGSAPSQGLFGKLVAAGKRALTGESIFVTHFTNNGRNQRRVAFAAPYPGKIVPLDLSEFGNRIVCQKHAFLCGAMGTKISLKLHKKFGMGLFGGEGFTLHFLEGDGLVFLHGCGAVVDRHLDDGQILRLEPGCLVATTATVAFDVQKAGNLKTMMFGGDGTYLATLTGPGRVWLQSLPFSRWADRVAGAPVGD